MQKRLTNYSTALQSGSVTYGVEAGAVISALVSTSSLLRYPTAPTPLASTASAASAAPTPLASTALAAASAPGGMQEYDDVDGSEARPAPAAQAPPPGEAVMLRHEGDSDSDSDDSVHMDSDEERAANAPLPVVMGPNGRIKHPKLIMTRGERSNWSPHHPDEIQKYDMVERMRLKVVDRSAIQLKGKGRRPGETIATQYVVLFQRVLQKGRDNPYTNYSTLARWVHRTIDNDIRTHLCKQFCWDNMNAPEVKKWLSNVLSGFRVLMLVFPDPHGNLVRRPH